MSCLFSFLLWGIDLNNIYCLRKMITSQFLGNRGEEESKGRVRQVCLAESREPLLRRKTSRIHHIRPSQRRLPHVVQPCIIWEDMWEKRKVWNKLHIVLLGKNYVNLNLHCCIYIQIWGCIFNFHYNEPYKNHWQNYKPPLSKERARCIIHIALIVTSNLPKELLPRKSHWL